MPSVRAGSSSPDSSNHGLASESGTAAPQTKVIATPKTTGSGHQVKAPLPGTILSVQVKPGDTVKAADTVVMLEAMKMENAIHAGRDGKVASVNVAQGEAVLEGAVLITLE